MGDLCAGEPERHPGGHQLESRARPLENAAWLQGLVYRSTRTLSGQWALGAQELAAANGNESASASVNGNRANVHGRRGLETRSGHRDPSVSHESENGHVSVQLRHWMNESDRDGLHENARFG